MLPPTCRTLFFIGLRHHRGVCPSTTHTPTPTEPTTCSRWSLLRGSVMSLKPRLPNSRIGRGCWPCLTPTELVSIPLRPSNGSGGGDSLPSPVNTVWTSFEQGMNDPFEPHWTGYEHPLWTGVEPPFSRLHVVGIPPHPVRVPTPTEVVERLRYLIEHTLKNTTNSLHKLTDTVRVSKTGVSGCDWIGAAAGWVQLNR